MEDIEIDNKETIIMNLVHYFVTEKNYNPVVVHGITDEIWLENMNSDYKIIRIVSKYIHNNEQLSFDKFRCKQITRKLRMKTLSLKMNSLNIYVSLGDNVTDLKDDKNNYSIFIKDMKDINDPMILDVFPDIIEKTHHDEEGMQLLFKITEDMNLTNEVKNKKMDKIFSSKKSIVTYILIGICMIMFLVSELGYSNEVLLKYGANLGILVKNGEFYRLFSAIFLHAGIVHIFFNMYSLYIVGARVEDFFGKWKYALIFLISGICGNMLSVGFHSDVISVGASGAIFGLFGALIYFGYTYRGYIGSIIRSQIMPIVIYNLVIGLFIPGIDMAGHVGGLIGGVITSKMLGTIENKKYSITDILLFIVYIGFLVYFMMR